MNNNQIRANHVLTMKEAAEYLRINYCTLSRKAKSGEIPCFRIGSKILFRLSALENWIAMQEATQEAIADVPEQSSVLYKINYTKKL